MTWRFPPMAPGDLNVDPFEGEFFATEALESLADPLVREAIQNSLDARATDGPVEVRFTLGRTDHATRDRYLEALWPHVAAALGPVTTLPGWRDPLTYLAVEDRKTRGLEGDPEQYEDTSETEGRNDFYYFWRNVGRSRKESTDRGRWGLGKTVFAAASRLQAFFGLTVRASDSRALLMGQAVLKIHHVDGKRHRPYGYFGARRERDDLALPMEKRESLLDFTRSFGLRALDDPGLSILIPYPDEGIQSEDLVQSVLLHYFQPLLAGKLRVEIVDGEQPTILQADTLEAEIRRPGRDRLRSILPLLSLARWGMEPEPEATAELASPSPGRAPKLTAERFDDGDLQRLRRRFDAGQRVAVGIHMAVQRKGEEPSQTRFLLVLEREDGIQRGEGHFVRQGITVRNPSARRPRGVRWIVLVADEVLSAFLGDAENPAHTEWQRSSPKFREKYELGPSTLDFVRAAPQNVVSILSRPAEGRDRDLLQGVFSLPLDSALDIPTKNAPTSTASDETDTTEGELDGFGSNGRLTLSRVRTGFRLRGHAGEGSPRHLRVLAAYEVLRGNPFRRYSSLDFRLDSRPVRIRAQGASVVARAENRLVLEVDGQAFDVLVTGFDEHRDLRIKVDPLVGEA